MAIVIIPPPTLAGGGDVTGGGDLNNANRVVIVAGTAEVGESDVSLASGVFSRAGTVGLSATGANVVTFATNGVERGRFSSDGYLLRGTDTVTSSTFANVGRIGAQNASGSDLSILALAPVETLGGFEAHWLLSSINGTGTHKPIGIRTNSTTALVAHTTGNITIGTTTDDASSKLQVAGTITGYAQTIYNPTATTGVTSAVIRAGAGQSTTALQKWTVNSGAYDLADVGSDGTFTIRAGGAFVVTNSTPVTSRLANTASVALVETTTNHPLVLRANSTERIRVDNTGIGFFGATPVAQQVEGAGDAAAIITALKNLGLMAP